MSTEEKAGLILGVLAGVYLGVISLRAILKNGWWNR